MTNITEIIRELHNDLYALEQSFATSTYAIAQKLNWIDNLLIAEDPYHYFHSLNNLLNRVKLINVSGRLLCDKIEVIYKEPEGLENQIENLEGDASGFEFELIPHKISEEERHELNKKLSTEMTEIEIKLSHILSRTIRTVDVKKEEELTTKNKLTRTACGVFIQMLLDEEYIKPNTKENLGYYFGYLFGFSSDKLKEDIGYKVFKENKNVAKICVDRLQTMLNVLQVNLDLNKK